MIYYTETNLNTEAKQAKILQVKHFLVAPLSTYRLVLAFVRAQTPHSLRIDGQKSPE